MQLLVRSLQGEEYIVQVQHDQSVAQLKAVISEKPNAPPVERQKLVYKGRAMQDNSLLSEYNLEEDCKVHLIVSKDPPLDYAAAPINSDAYVNRLCFVINALGELPSSSGTVPSAEAPIGTNNSSSPIALGDSSSVATNNEPKPNAQASNVTTTANQQQQGNRPLFEVILRERLASHFPAGAVDRIVANLYQEIDADINSSSLDDLERLAKQKLNITNE